jgi:hypothetical protein
MPDPATRQPMRVLRRTFWKVRFFVSDLLSYPADAGNWLADLLRKAIWKTGALASSCLAYPRAVGDRLGDLLGLALRRIGSFFANLLSYPALAGDWLADALIIALGKTASFVTKLLSYPKALLAGTTDFPRRFLWQTMNWIASITSPARNIANEALNGVGELLARFTRSFFTVPVKLAKPCRNGLADLWDLLESAFWRIYLRVKRKG